MKVLFIHPNVPGQYKHLCREFAKDPKNKVVFISCKVNPPEIPGVTIVPYKVNREPQKDIHRYLINFEKGIHIGQEVWRVCNKLKKKGFTPDVICAHPGWGDTLFVKEAYPDTPLLSFQEFFYNNRGSDVNFDPNEQFDDDELSRIKIKNAINLFGINYCDWGISPMEWQKAQYPKEFHSKISVLHDGIDTEKAAPTKWDSMEIKGIKINHGDEVLTYISRNFEPYRGFPTFMKAAKALLEKRPKLRILCVGADGVSYGKTTATGKPYRHTLIEQLKPDMTRMHFLGYLPYDEMLKVLQVSSAHVYLTFPFVLSWSMLEAMSTGCVVVGSNTPPVLEVIEHKKNGLIADFFSPEDVAEKVSYALDNQEKMKEIRKNARNTVIDRFDLKKIMPMQMDLIRDLGNRKLPPPTDLEIKKFTNKIIKKAA